MKTTHRCSLCETVKPFTADHFYVLSSNRWCKPCNSARHKERYQKRRGTQAPAVPAKTCAGVVQRTMRAERDVEMIAIGEEIVRKCPKAYHAVDAITSGWWALKESEA